jgi:hypothetical protein
MTDAPQTPESSKPAKAASGKEARLKAALKANMARRKAQTRARRGADEPQSGAMAPIEKE